ncbi:Uma2 family endonuclease [Synechococcus sp. H55.7]|uniref:Uma2 family endonuclease n=2 Tax=Synechococcus TaxID=1129 RepID=UPI0039C07877
MVQVPAQPLTAEGYLRLTNWPYEKRDYQDKRKDCAAGGIPEYWIGDPAKQSVSVLRWVGGEYEDEVKTGPERIVASVLPQLDLSVEEILQARRSV